MSHDSAHLSITRRGMLGAAAAIAAAPALALADAKQNETVKDSAKPPADWKIEKGQIQQSAVHWCFKPLSIAELAAGAAKLGIRSVELIGTSDWKTLKEHKLVCAISGSHGFAKGFAHKEEHEECLTKLRESIEATAAARFPSVITFSGFRRGLSDEEGQKNMVEGLKKIVGFAEEKKVTLCLEMLNSRVDIEMKGHPDYMCDTIEWGVEVCKRVGSPRLKMLFDIYHVQIMQGDIITRIKKFHEYIGHYHTAGVPGRNEIDDSQEISYPAIMKTIVETGYKGYVGQEFIPARKDFMASLAQAARICDV